MMPYYYGDYGWGYDPFSMVFHVLGWVLIIVLIFMAIRMIMGHGRRPNWRHMMGNSALDVLAERYAKGEISKEEYIERKKTLSE